MGSRGQTLNLRVKLVTSTPTFTSTIDFTEDVENEVISDPVTGKTPELGTT